MMIGETMDGNSVIAMLIAAIAIFMLITGIRRKQRERARSSPRQPAPSFSAATINALDNKEKLRRDLEVLVGELQDLSRKITAEIDTRFSKLETTIRDADRRIAALSHLSRAASQKTTDEVEQSPDQDIRHTIVYELADAGFSPMEIAKDLGRTPGEIELILNLRRTAQKE